MSAQFQRGLDGTEPYSFCHPNTMDDSTVVRGDRYSRANLMPIYGDLYQIKL